MLKKSLPKLALAFLLAVILILGLFTGCSKDNDAKTPGDTTTDQSGEVYPDKDPSKKTITITAVRPLSGQNVSFEYYNFGPIYRMWVDEVNKAGGIRVKEYGNRLLTIDLKIYDDTSDVGVMTDLLIKTMTQDKPDFVLSPCSTAALQAAAPIFNQYGYMLIGAEGGGTDTRPLYDKYPDLFFTTSFASHQIPKLAEIFNEVGVKKVFITYMQDAHGLEYLEVAKEELPKYNIEYVEAAAPWDFSDVTPIITQAMDSGADAFVAFVYPPWNTSLISTGISMGYNPKAWLCGPGGSQQALYESAGGEAINGMMFEGAWSVNSGPAFADFAKRIEEYYADDPNWSKEWWGTAGYYGAMEMLQIAIEETGTLDNHVIAEYLRNNEIQTSLGPMKFENHELTVDSWAGMIGQYIDGVAEVIDVGTKRTHDPLYPKPDWPAK
ncbi:MAG: ABC transporter substrate-binding protein [Papillibacter sp.]|jgi:branched-chain amino acid transport system substrate-binding protein|nr:ABC transporter substrate-binding protein [Papillibacter sp.]